MYKVIYHYDYAHSEELKITYKTRMDAWHDVMKLDPTLLTGLNLVEVTEIRPSYYIVGNRTGETWLSLHSIMNSLEEAEAIKASISIGGYWNNVRILTEVE